ncbi:MAG: flagellar export chaperone FliS [bacterium]
MALSNPYTSYRNTEVKTASPVKLVVLLYEGAVQNMKKGEALLGEPDRFPDASVHLLRAMNIVSELLGTLNPKASVELSERLSGIYSYVLDLIGKSLERRDPAPLNEAVGLMNSLGSAWREIAGGAS